MNRCPICKAPASPRSVNRAFPFCSERCRLVDLGRWLSEGYRIPGPAAGDGAGAEQPSPDDDGERD